MSELRHNYSKNFCRKTVDECLVDVQNLTCFNLVTMVGVGVTFLLKAFEQKSTARVIFINSFELSEYTREAVLTQLSEKLGLETVGTLQEVSNALSALSEQEDRVVLLFNRIDRLGDAFDQHMYENLFHLRNASRGKIVIGFVSALPLLEMSPISSRSILSLVTKTTYFQGYSNEDLLEICRASGVPNTDIDERALSYAGGIHTLFQVLIRSQSLEHPLSDPFIEGMVKDIYFRLNTKRRKQLETFVLKGTVPSDAYLQHIGYLTGEPLRMASPLLQKYIAKNSKHYQPTKEKRLLKILLASKGRIVTKTAIFDYVWKEDGGIASDWALNALIYRLKRHPGFDADRYTIESRKKEGYVIHDHNV